MIGAFAQADTELVSAGRCSEMDIVLDLWRSTVYNNEQVQGSKVGQVVYLRNGTGSPLVNYSELAAHWGISRATVGKILKKLAGMEYISLMTFPGRTGSVIYLQNYLSTMFQISDVLIDKEEVAISCFRCPKSIYKLYPLSNACRVEYISHIQETVVRFGMTVSCGDDKPVYTFELTLSPPKKTGKEVTGHEKESGKNEYYREPFVP